MTEYSGFAPWTGEGCVRLILETTFPLCVGHWITLIAFTPHFFTTEPGRNGVENCQNIHDIGISTVQPHNLDISRLYPKVAFATLCGKAIASQTRTGNRTRASSHENQLQAFDHSILMTTLSLGSRSLLERNPETSQRPLSTVFLGCNRFLTGIDWAAPKANTSLSTRHPIPMSASITAQKQV